MVFTPRMMRGILRRSAGLFFLGVSLVLVPFATSVWHLCLDPGLRSCSPSSFAFRMHRSLSQQIPDYVDERIASGKAETLGTHEISATEWPVYGAFFYLLATENLQQQWELNPSLSDTAPSENREAIDASLRIMLDEGHAHWIREYWGDDHLQQPNCFYKMLLTGCLTAHHNLTGNDEHLSLLRQVVDGLVKDIDASPSGLIDDYPSQCFPADVGVAIAMVRHADSALGSDHSAWAERSLRRMLGHFGGSFPPYTARAMTGQPITQSRGCTNGFFLSFAREVSPDVIDPIYQKYAGRFWQKGWFCAGWREFPNGRNSDDTTYFDPDSGPVIAGYGTSATGLGLGAARRHGDHARAGQLGAELIATSLPLPSGRLLLPSLVADHEHAPLFPELVLLHQLSITREGPAAKSGVPLIVWLVLGLEALLGTLSLRIAWGLFQGPGVRNPKTGSTDGGGCQTDAR